MKYFLTASTRHLEPILRKNKAEIEQISCSRFSDNELSFQLKERMKGQSVTILASVLPNPNSLFELLAIAHLLRTNRVKNLTLIIPYLGYARQDRPTRAGEGATGIMVAELLKNLRADNLFVLEPHSPAIQRALGKNAVALNAAPLFAEYFKDKQIDMVVAPDKGAWKRAEWLVKLLPGAEAGWIEKNRPRPNQAVAKKLHGRARGKNILLFDDMIDTGGTIIKAAELLKENGAKAIYVAAAHGIFSDAAVKKLAKAPVEEIVVTNSLPQTEHPRIRVLNFLPLIKPKRKPAAWS